MPEGPSVNAPSPGGDESSAPGRDERTWVPGGQRSLRRRGLWRAAAGVGVLLGVAALHVLRGSAGSPAEPRFPAPAPPAVSTPLPPPLVAEEELPHPAFSVPDTGEIAPASLRLDFEHSIKDGTLLLSVDGEPLLERRLETRVYKKVLFFNLRRGQVRETIEVGPGERRVRVEVRSKHGRLSETIAGTFEAGTERTLRITIPRGDDSLSLEWR